MDRQESPSRQKGQPLVDDDHFTINGRINKVGSRVELTSEEFTSTLFLHTSDLFPLSTSQAHAQRVS